MARPQRDGIDYFPLDIDIFEDDKMEYITARFDEKGELLVIKLLCAVYRNGYYTDWNEDKALIFAKRAGKNISHSLANDVVNELVKRGFFDKGIFNSFEILTSHGIQQRYLTAVTGRKNININLDYWLLEPPQNTKKTTFLITTGRNGVNPGSYSQIKINKSNNRYSIITNAQNEILSGEEKKPQEAVFADTESVFEKCYKRYPRKKGKIEGKQHFIQYLTNGRSIEGQGKIKLNHVRISIAIQQYGKEVEEQERREDKILYFSSFMSNTVVEYAENTKEEYETAMKEYYGENWKEIKFRYEYNGKEYMVKA